MVENTHEARTTPEGTEFTIAGGRIVFPTPEHELGGGVDVRPEIVSEILMFPEAGKDEKSGLEWEHVDESRETRVGSSKVIELRASHFGTERTTRVTLVDIADADVEL